MRQQVRFKASFFSGDLTHLNQLYLFGHDVTLPELPPEDDRLRALLAGNEVTCGQMGKYQKNALEQPGPVAWKTILHH